MNFKKDQTIYVKCAIGISVANGYEGKVHRINKKDGDLYSITIRVSKKISVSDGITIATYNNTFRVGLKCYEFFDTKAQFIESMKQAYYNQIDIIDRTIHDLRFEF